MSHLSNKTIHRLDMSQVTTNILTV
uniref:Uncharacterized protein n=1 Tax=Arundo donax TaxID=35708 RepID=A0A0A8YCY8_ARUDO